MKGIKCEFQFKIVTFDIRSFIQLSTSSPRQKACFSKRKKELPLVALFEQEKISFSASGLFVTIWAMGLGSDRKYCFLNLNHFTSCLANLGKQNHKSCQAESKFLSSRIYFSFSVFSKYVAE
jgi:hypothetical protein